VPAAAPPTKPKVAKKRAKAAPSASTSAAATPSTPARYVRPLSRGKITVKLRNVNCEFWKNFVHLFCSYYNLLILVLYQELIPCRYSLFF